MKQGYLIAFAGMLALTALVPVWGQRGREQAATPEAMARSIAVDLREARGLVVRLLPPSGPPARDRERRPDGGERGGEGRNATDRRRLEFLLERAERTARDLEGLETEITRLRGGDSPRSATPVPAAVSEEDFKVILDTYNARFFSNEKMDYLRSVARKYYFECRQLEALVEATFATSDRMETVYILYPRVLDKERIFTLEKQFLLSSDWKEVCKKLGIEKP